MRADFIERMEFEYGAKAEATGALCASAAGFDSVVGGWVGRSVKGSVG